MSSQSRAMRDIERQAAAELAMHRSAGRSATERAQQQSGRLIMIVSSIAAVVAVWDLSLLVRVGPG